MRIRPQTLSQPGSEGRVENPALPRIRVIAVGGTIASVAEEGGTAVSPRLSGKEMLERSRVLGGVARLEVRDLATVPSYDMDLSDVVKLARLIGSAPAGEFDGVVITQGTDTIEETAYGLALMLKRGMPVVVTGAMTPGQHLSSDGPRNLTAAIRVAATPVAAQLGAVVVANDLIHAARWVVKLHTSNVASLGSPQAGAIGEIVEGNVEVWFFPAYDDYIGLPSGPLPRIELVRLYPGAGEAALRATVESEPGGIVIEGTGGGHVPSPLLPVIDEALAAAIPVVLATRCPGGRVLERTYDMPGSEMDLIRRGARPAGTLSGSKARLRLAVGLALGRSPAELFPV